MATIGGPNIIQDGLVLHLDAANIKSFRGEPTTNYQNNITPWTVGGINTDVTNTSDAGPINNAKTWKFEKTGTSNQWNGWESDYSGIWTGNAGDIWTTSYWYKTSSSAGLLYFGIGGYYKTDWSAAYSVTTLSSISSIIPDGQWHFNYTTTRINENYNRAIIADGPSFPYSTSAGLLYINGLQWEKKDHPTPFVNGTRGATVATGGGWADLSGNENHGELVSGVTYNNYNLGSLVFDGVDDYIQFPSNLDVSNVFSLNVWIKPTSKTRQTIFSNAYTYQIGKGFFWTVPGNSSTETFISLGKDQKGAASNIVDTNQIQMLTIVVNSNELIKIYKNGIESSSYSWQTDANLEIFYDVGTFRLGDRSLSPGDKLNSQIYNASIYNKALTQSEILQIYNAKKGLFGL